LASGVSNLSTALILSAMHLPFSTSQRKIWSTKKREWNLVLIAPISDATMSDQGEAVSRRFRNSLDTDTTCLDTVLPFAWDSWFNSVHYLGTKSIQMISRASYEAYVKDRIAEFEIRKFIAFASGYDDVLILLESSAVDRNLRWTLPCLERWWWADQNCHERFMVHLGHCYTVILDVVPSKPKGRSYFSDEECYEITE
jgi:hypothetical protein